MRPLNERAPQLPWIELANLPTPVQRLDWPESSAAKLWAKRDDLTSPVYGGNKVRKLEYLLGRALARNHKAVLTFGAMGSNHVLATARFCEQLGLDCIAIMSRQAMTSYLPGNLAATIRSGAELHSCPRFRDIANAAKTAAQTYMDRHGSKPMLVPPGGSSEVGALGFVNAAFELDRQIEQGVLPEPDRIYVALGTMGSVVGLTLGLAALKRRTEVVAVKVVVDEVADPDTMRFAVATDQRCCFAARSMIFQRLNLIKRASRFGNNTSATATQFRLTKAVQQSSRRACLVCVSRRLTPEKRLRH